MLRATAETLQCTLLQFVYCDAQSTSTQAVLSGLREKKGGQQLPIASAFQHGQEIVGAGRVQRKPNLRPIATMAVCRPKRGKPNRSFVAAVLGRRRFTRPFYGRHPLNPFVNSTPNFTIEHTTGRLVQTRLNVLSDSREMCHVQAALHSVLSGIPGQAVICTDLTKLDLFSPKLADSVCEMLATTSVKVLRGAILLQAEKATLNLQVERMIREAGSTSRRTFRSTKKMLDWLAEVLTPEELSSAREFLARPD